MKISKRIAGFTLVEMLVVIALVTVSLGYFSQLLMADYERKQWDRTVNDLLTLNRALSLSYLDKSGLWPGQAVYGGSCAIDAMKTDLNVYLPGFSYTELQNINGQPTPVELYTYSCLDERFEVETSFLNDADAADYIANNLPIAEVTNANEVRLYVIKPRRAANSFRLVSATVDALGVATFPKANLNCSNEDKQIIVQPEKVCVPNNESIGGFFIDIDGSSSAQWEVSLQSRNDDESDVYTVVQQCEGAAISFRAALFCQS